MLNLDTPAGIYGSNHGRRQSLVNSAMPARVCDICGRAYLGRRSCQPPLGRDLTVCPREQGWRRRQILAALLQGQDVPGVAENSRLRRDADVILATRVSSQPGTAAEARADEPEAEPPQQEAARVSREPVQQ